jgi:two-component system KDP operon response regulator KdpE
MSTPDEEPGAVPGSPASTEGLRPVVLVIEDERPIRRFLRSALDSAGYRVIEVGTGEEGLREAATRSPDAVLLDLGLPDRDGIEVTRRLREWSQVPILVLSARGQERDKVAALDAGADDYVTKPFAVGELLARIRVALRHRSRAPVAGDEPVVVLGPLQVDLARRRVSVDDREVRLTPTEFRLLAVLVRHPGRVVTHAQLLREVWGPGTADATHYVRVYMAQLRSKLEADPSLPTLLLTEPGVGYRTRDP